MPFPSRGRGEGFRKLRGEVSEGGVGPEGLGGGSDRPKSAGQGGGEASVDIKEQGKGGSTSRNGPDGQKRQPATINEQGE